ncbi:MAG: hypothetical protein IPK83_14505 [Planctomycetes bacterium]|nr:hypothetical protein [Planctomycetota bacterium]
MTASWEPGGTPSPMAENHALLYAPWVLAMLSSCIICALGLAIAKLINYRPGGMPPVLILLFAIPVLLFHSFVGRDELEFRILENEFGRSSSSVFAPVDIGALAQQAASARWSQTSSGSFDTLFDEIYGQTRTGILDRIEQKRLDAVTLCDAFIERFPQSQHIPDVLFLKARTLDLRIDLAKLERKRLAEFRADLPSPASRQTWLTLSERFPTYTGSATALYRLAILAACAGDFSESIHYLETIGRRFSAMPEELRGGEFTESVVGSAFKRSTTLTNFQADVVLHIERAEALREIIEYGRLDTPRRLSEVFVSTPDESDEWVRPVQLFLRLDPSNPDYKYNLTHLAECFPNSNAAGYIEIRLAGFESSPENRIEQLRLLANCLTAEEGGAEARFMLADALHESNAIEPAKRVFSTLKQAHSESIWSKRAAKRLKSMEALQAHGNES